jgi:PIN domain nuclease of toxin-antitoxin system
VFLLDTHTFIWLCMDWKKLPPRLISLFESDPDGLFISSITVVETGLLVNSGRVSLPCSCEYFFQKNLKYFRIQGIPVDVEIGIASTKLPPIHRDPFDRILIATAQKHKLTILTKDQTIPTYPKVKAIWE